MKSSFLKFKEAYMTVHVLVPIAIIIGLLYFVLPEWEVHQPPGILSYQAPRLTPPSVKTSFQYKDYSITPLADYELKARVLDKALYYWGGGADLAPVDLLLSWKEMSDTAILKYFSFRLSGRWYSWHAKSLPMPEEQINNDLDNNHLIPSTSAIEHQLKNVRIGEIVRIKGFLVSANGKNGYNWRSSLNIGSTGGPMSCKLIYVMKFDVAR